MRATSFCRRVFLCRADTRRAKLNEDVARCGASLLRSAVEALAGGRAPRVAQDERAATYAPRVRPGTPMVRFDEWDVERVWHFLAGLSPRFREPLIDRAGHPASYQAVIGFERGPLGHARHRRIRRPWLEAQLPGWGRPSCQGPV